MNGRVRISLVATSAILVLLACLAGCGAEPTQFRPNTVRAMSLAASRDLPSDAAMRDVQQRLEIWFGTPDQPRWPDRWLESTSSKQLVSMEKLTRAAGAVTSDRDDVHTGLYQEHCVVCHGISGSGAGPAAQFQSPYPRDLRAGVFKWKSTARNQKPTRDDLTRLLLHGVNGAAMPSFQLIPREDREALVDYLIYLSVRGEVERELLAAAIDELDYEETPPEADLRLISTSSVNLVDEAEPIQTEGTEVAVEVLRNVVKQWVTAKPTPVPEDPVTPQDLAGSIERGKALFHGQIANCAACHGEAGRGGVLTKDYDDWTKEFTTRIGITPEDRESVKPYRKAGALPPREINPRHLAGGGLRGGDDPETLFRRIQHGIAGTPMPGVGLKSADDEASTGLSAEQIWDLVHYLQILTGAPAE